MRTMTIQIMLVVAIILAAASFAPVKGLHASALQLKQVQTDKATTIRQEKTMGTTRGAWFVEMVEASK